MLVGGYKFCSQLINLKPDLFYLLLNPIEVVKPLNLSPLFPFLYNLDYLEFCLCLFYIHTLSMLVGSYKIYPQFINFKLGLF
jgi:hypothetical protein